MTYAFVFDASACSGCKACQIACKDKNSLPAGVLWRRVYEVSGGSWQQYGNAWVTDVFAYNLSIACNHCVHPKCAGVCPTDAYVTREDGIVYIDAAKCIGCGYCNWACPYAAPQLDAEQGKVGKCNFCYDNIDAGLPPACVAACPLRALDFVEVSSDPLPAGSENLWQIPASQHPFPLPAYSRTEPHLAIKPHAGMLNGLEKVVSNRQEIRPGKGKSKIGSLRHASRRFWAPASYPLSRRPDVGELSLVAFTLLGQMAAGMAVFSFFSGPLSIPVLVTLGVLIGLAGLSSLLHLGSPGNAWRAIFHLKKSWLSREILLFVLFGGSWFITLAMPGMGKLPLALSGMGLVYSMAQVYRLRSIPAWNSNRTLLAFAASAFVLGGMGLKAVDIFANPSGSGFSSRLLIVGLVGALAAALLERDSAHGTAGRLRPGLIGLGIIGMLATVFAPHPVGKWIIVPILAIVLVEEGIGRWRFYEHPHRRNL